MTQRALSSLFAIALATACASPDGDGAPEGAGGAPANREVFAPVAPESVRLTDAGVRLPVQARRKGQNADDPRIPELRGKLLSEGFGDLQEQPGWAHVTRSTDGAAPPAAGTNPRRLAHFVHLPDTQLADDESPGRLATMDTAGATGGAYRPHEGHECRILNAAVLTINTLAAEDPVDFVLLGGDNIDSALQNELDWFLGILKGSASVECDSGADDDDDPAAIGGPKDPFIANGLDVPYYWVTGNHDVLTQGNFPYDERRAKEDLGDKASWGRRDWSKLGAPVVQGPVDADARRVLLDGTTLHAAVRADDDGHGLPATLSLPGKGFYTFDVPNTPLRFVILDTTATTGAADGLILQSQVDTWIKPTLDQAKAEGKWVLLSSHHASASLTDGGGFGGHEHSDAVLPDAWRAFIAGYDNVLFSIVAHSHQHRVSLVGPEGGHQWWEVMTSALSDFPNQLRAIEIWDEDNGWLKLRATALDVQADHDPVVVEGHRLATLDYVLGWGDEGLGEAAGRNVELWIQKPVAVTP